MIDTWLPLIGGLVLLVAGGELLVRGAVKVAAGLGVSPLVIGVTLVGFGTSTPELVTSVQAALAGSPGIAFGNIVGSNIANTLLIAGASAILCPIVIASVALRRDGMVMIIVAFLFAAITALMPLERIVGLCFVGALAVYIYLAFRQEKVAADSDHGAVYDKSLALQETDKAVVPEAPSELPLALSLLIAIGGLVLVIAGGYFLVEGAVTLARDLGISETVIGLTIIAIGTSMPELVTCVVAALKRHGDVAFGNIVGSNIYNILGIGGMTALIAPSAVPSVIVSFDNIVMCAVAVLLAIMAYTRLRIDRWEGGILLAGYGAYLYAIWPTG